MVPMLENLGIPEGAVICINLILFVDDYVSTLLLSLPFNEKA